jgi:hypothetical protein
MAVVSNGTTIVDAGALGASAGAGKLTLIKTLTASSSSTLSFVNGASSVVFNSTYDSYIFKFINCHPASNGVKFEFNFSTDSGSNYNVTKSSTQFCALNSEGGGGELGKTGGRLAQSTNFQRLVNDADLGADSDQSISGTLQIFAPADTTFVKHFISTTQYSHSGDYSVNVFTSGYGNTTSSIDAIRFQMSSGNIDAGTIKMYGVG